MKLANCMMVHVICLKSWFTKTLLFLCAGGLPNLLLSTSLLLLILLTPQGRRPKAMCRTLVLSIRISIRGIIWLNYCCLFSDKSDG